MSELATREISIFELVSVAVEASLSLILLEIPKTGFLAARPDYKISQNDKLLSENDETTLFNCIKYITHISNIVCIQF